MSETGDVAELRTAEALKAAGFADMRPAYRELMRRLKRTDPATFGEAATRHAEQVVPAITDEEADPVATWVAYGKWLAEATGPGRLVQLDPSGLATPAAADPVAGHVLLYLQDDASERAIPLARPASPSPAQAAALDLLAD